MLCHKEVEALTKIQTEQNQGDQEKIDQQNVQRGGSRNTSRPRMEPTTEIHAHAANDLDNKKKIGLNQEGTGKESYHDKPERSILREEK